MSRVTAQSAERDAPARRGFEPAAERAEAERQTGPLRLLQPREEEIQPEEEAPLTLPTLATAADVREAVQYLKKKPAGVSVVEAMDDVKRRVFEPRKVAAYEFWGVVVRRHERLELSPLGWEFARKLEPEAEAYRSLLDRAAPYRSALAWIHEQNLDLVTHADVAAFWQQLYGDAQERTTEGNVLSFFHLCQAAELGTVTIGKRGQPARLRVEREELAAYVEGSRQAEAPAAAEKNPAFPLVARASAATTTARTVDTRRAPQVLRVLVSAGRETKLVRQIQTALELADIQCRVILRGDADAAFVSEEEFQLMRQCEAAIVVATRDDCAGGALNRNLLLQLGAAFVRYDRRVALLWDASLPVPEDLREFPHFAFEEDELTWEVGVGLLKAVKDFQEHARQVA